MPAARSRSRSTSKAASRPSNGHSSRSKPAASPINVDSGEEEVEAVDVVEEDEEDDSEGGEDEYEVQAVLDHKFKKGKYEYLVAWKGYGPEHNTWEPQDNVEHAEDLVKSYWEKQPKETAGNVRKRGRPSAADAASSPKPKKGRPESASNANTRADTASVSDDDVTDYHQTHIDSVEKYMDIPDWEDLVKSIDTVERTSDGQLMVFLTMKDGAQLGQTTSLVNKRCPQQIIKFYETHLKFVPMTVPS
ncbi:Chromo domain-containing protein 2 [Vanrija pseudolonga]|uniref:Chromo domain-containing protein 2 n=1 Tax=Vanrija pseudolonga TaxID=143232 RepID=A0AAF0Y5Y7_9TREE|nr:Chromo domain-containing protein 2 [Vanrija pseudolonga]